MMLRTTKALRIFFPALVSLLALTSNGWSQQADEKPVAFAPAVPTAAVEPAKDKKGKPAYVGPNTVVQLPALPVLDSEGKQQLDPDGKVMFYPPIMQQREKSGHPRFDGDGKPVMQTAKDLGYDEEGNKLHVKKVKEAKKVSVSIVNGTLTVDGMTSKARLDYEIEDLKYIYLFAPWVGVTVVSNAMFPGAVEQKNAFDNQTLTVTVSDHTFQLSSDKRLLGKNSSSAFVRVDGDALLASKSPLVGYGTTRTTPYAWPGSKTEVALKGSAGAPELPLNMRPVQQLQACPAGQMRMVAPKALPGQVVKAQPCVLIPKG